MLAALEARRAIDEPVALVVAHPDDETLAAGGSMHLMRHLLLVHVTDGAPTDLDDAAREGFATPQAYAAARRDELNLALSLSGADPERACLDVPDQRAVDAVGTIAERLGDLLRPRGIRQILTHAYEGGHPDHDAVALAVSLAADRVHGQVYEFTGYHAGPLGGLETSAFLRRAGSVTTEVALPPSDLSRKRAMLACFASQADMLAQLETDMERFRAAPAYDFAQPPHPGRLLYEEWGWMTGADWRRRASRSAGRAAERAAGRANGP